MTRLASLLACFCLTGCAGAQVAQVAQEIEPGAEFTLAPAEAASMKGAKLSVRFVSVLDDSRCPRDATCVWAGEVKVRLEINGSQAEVLEGGSTVANAFRVTLVRVEPQRTSTTQIAPQDYRATLMVEK